MKPRIWSLISLLLFLTAIFFWFKGNELRDRDRRAAALRQGSVPHKSSRSRPAVFPLLTQLGAAAPANSTASAPAPTPGVPAASTAAPTRPALRLSNTDKSISELARSDSAILLRNAFIDTASRQSLAVPAKLRAGAEPGSYIVQARGAPTRAFRAQLAAFGAEIVSYIPNNAFLVRVSASGAGALGGSSLVAAVLPYEPYYKLDERLLALAVADQPLPEGGWVNLVGFPGQREAALAEIGALGAEVLAETRSPFGPQFVVAPTVRSLAALAALPSVQLIEVCADRVVLNDLTRTRLGISATPDDTNNYFNLTGSNIWVNINDTGVDGEHPDLKGRVVALSTNLLTDTNGHGTHVAGVIASSGKNGPTLTNAFPGSLTNSSFRGMAPAAKLLVSPIDVLTGPTSSDAYLQEVAARTNYAVLRRTNTMVSNNSWGYPQFDYDAAAASYDAAVRDALPDMVGPQPIIYVFAAGNNGAGNDVGMGGEPGTITSPATAKNVITVGAIDNLRKVSYLVTLTNEAVDEVDGVMVTNVVVTTNAVQLGETDSDDEVTPFSSRGNVGVGTEGLSGRFKPDLVAPGAFVVSTRATGWEFDSAMTNREINLYTNQVASPGALNNYSILLPNNVTNLVIETLPNPFSPSPFPALAIYVKQGDFPTAADYLGTNRVVIDSPGEGDWFYSIGPVENQMVTFDLRTTVTTYLGMGTNYATVLSNLNASLKPNYRLDSGTSIAAGGVSGMLALIQEFFEQKLQKPYSPALLKALLINGARSLGPLYSFQVQNRINYQGWGLPQLPNVLPAALTNSPTDTDWPLRWVDQSPTNALVTGQAHTYELTVPEAALEADLRVTLVWTDPPGNPSAAIKLVNDLDLVVSNQTTHEVFVGNYIPANSDFNTTVAPPEINTNTTTVTNTTSSVTNTLSSTNLTLALDNVNNVENVFLRHPLGTNTYTIYVMGRRVNVNAVTAHTNGIAQDYALVASISATNAITFKQTATSTIATAGVTVMTNGVPLLKQRAGANSPLLGGAVGTSNQWHFYVFTNTTPADMPGITNGPYVAFITFMPPNISKPRNLDSDIDLYVSRGGDQGLLTLDPGALGAAFTSRKRGGSEVVTFTDAATNEVFYIGVKAEDQMASEYGFVAISSTQPFESIDGNGNHVIYGLPMRVVIPDGTPVDPAAALVFAVAITPIKVNQVIVEDTVIHDEFGDLLGNLSHESTFAVLNNHSSYGATDATLYDFIYDDSRSGDFPGSVAADGPGSLMDFVGMEGSGAWMLTMVDNSLGHTGLVERLQLRLQPTPDLEIGVYGSVLANQWKYYYFDVPPDASRLTVLLSSMTGPLNVYLRRGTPPTTTEYDKAAFLQAPGGELSLGITDAPPLVAGRYYIGLYNPSAATVDYFLRIRLDRNLSSAFRRDFTQTNLTVIGDDVLTLSSNVVGDSRVLTDIKVGVRVDYPRVSDLAFYLVSPQGARVLLNENRGGTDRTQYGFEVLSTNFHHVALTYSTNAGAALYLDGEFLIGNTNSMGRRMRTTNDFFLGRKASTNATQYLGMMDEVDLYRRALAGPEIRAIYKFGGAGKTTNGLVSRWPFDGNGNDLQATNLAVVSGAAYIEGKFGSGLLFSGLGQQVRMTNNASLDVGAGEGFTIDAWINPQDLSVERPLALWSDGTNKAGVEFYIRPGPDTNLNPGQLSARLVDVTGVTNELIAPIQGMIRTNGAQTNIVYTTFTENTNLATLPIKFGTPATGPAVVFTNNLISGFDTVVLTNGNTTNIATDGVFDNWWVTNGTVTVLRSPRLAHTGTNLLALRSGAVVRYVTTETNKLYRLQLAHRLSPGYADSVLSWWRGENDASDFVGTNHGSAVGTVRYTNAMVGRGFSFTNTEDYIRVPANATLNLTNELTMEMWFRLATIGQFGGGLFSKHAGDPTNGWFNYAASISTNGLDLWFNDLLVIDPTSDGGSRFEMMRMTNAIAAGVYHHFAGSFKQVSPTQVEMSVYLDGTLQKSKVLRGVLANGVNSGDLLIGATLPGTNVFNGVLDEVTLHKRVLTGGEIADIYAMDRVGKCPPPFLALTRLVVNSASSNAFYSDGFWQTNTMLFTATSTNTQVELRALQAGVLIDSMEITEVASTYFLPEEAMKTFIGQSALGTWRLEVYDTRLGITNAISSDLISWRLELTFAPISYPVIRLANGVSYTNTIPANQARYFSVDVPRSANMATNTLMAAPNGLDLFFNQNGLPQFDPLQGDYRLMTNTMASICVISSTNGTTLVDTNGVALYPANELPQLVPGQRYYLALTNFSAPSQYVIRVDFDKLDTNILGLTVLTNTQTILTNIAVTNALQYYRYTVSTNAIAASFEVYPTNGNVNLYLRKATATIDPLPTPWVFDYASELPGTNAEIIIVTQNSLVPLASGDWYLGVQNVETNSVDYRIHVVEYTNVIEEVITLFDGVPDSRSIGPDGIDLKYFKFGVTNTPAAVQFDLYDLTGAGDLMVRLGGKPVPTNYFQLDPGVTNAPARITVRTNDTLPSLQGDWYLTVVNQETRRISFSIMASIPSGATSVVDLVSGVLRKTTLAADTAGTPAWLDYYRFVVSPGATLASFEVFPINGNVDLVLRKDSLPDMDVFDYRSDNPGNENETILLAPGSLPVPLSAGEWFLGVYNQGIHSVTYSVRAAQTTGVGSGAVFRPVLSVSVGGIGMSWDVPAGMSYELQYATNIPAQWITITTGVSTSGGSQSFVDDEATSGGRLPFKIYRLKLGE